MANTKISALPAATSLASTDVVPVVQGGVTKKAALSLTPYLPAGTGAVATTVQSKLRESVSVTDYGADPTGVTDSTTTIQAGIDAALAAGKQIIAQGTFRISAKVVIKGDTDFSQATFNVYSTPAIALEVSTGNAANPTTILYSSVIWLPKRINNMTKPATGWAGQGIGVRTVNTYGCQIFVGTINNFQTGFFPTSYNTGNVFNTYFLGILENNQQNLRLEPGDATSWVNNNTFIGGACSFYSAEGSNVSGCYDINIQQFAGGLGPPNNNLFVNTSIEADTPEFHILCAGSFNTFQQLRFEATTPKVRFTGTSANNGTRNMILGGYTLESVVVSYSGTTGKNNVLFGAGTEVFEMGTSSKPLRFQNISSSGADISRIYEAGLDPWANGSDWSVAESSQYLYAKRAADANPRMWLDYVNARMYVGTGAATPTAYIGAFGASTLGCSASVWPTTDNARTLGDASYRWSVVYAATGTINTSDEREKQQVRSLSDAENAVAVRCKKLLKAFKFNDSVVEKGDKARIHFGVIAQDVKAAFEAEGLDATQYAMLCYDEWTAELDENGNEVRPAGNRYGVRYEELLAFIISAL